jgi:hypothetical protein
LLAVLGDPGVGEGGDLGDDGCVFLVVGEGGAFGEGAEGVVVFAGEGEVVGVEGEDGVLGGVGLNPLKGLQPVAAGGFPGEFEVAGGGVAGALGVAVDGGEGDKDEQPAEEVGAEDVLAQCRAGKQEHEQEGQVQVAHGLQGG